MWGHCSNLFYFICRPSWYCLQRTRTWMGPKHCLCWSRIQFHFNPSAKERALSKVPPRVTILLNGNPPRNLRATESTSLVHNRDKSTRTHTRTKKKENLHHHYSSCAFERIGNGDQLINHRPRPSSFRRLHHPKENNISRFWYVL